MTSRDLRFFPQSPTPYRNYEKAYCRRLQDHVKRRKFFIILDLLKAILSLYVDGDFDSSR